MLYDTYLTQETFYFLPFSFYHLFQHKSYLLARQTYICSLKHNKMVQATYLNIHVYQLYTYAFTYTCITDFCFILGSLPLVRLYSIYRMRHEIHVPFFLCSHIFITFECKLKLHM